MQHARRREPRTGQLGWRDRDLFICRHRPINGRNCWKEMGNSKTTQIWQLILSHSNSGNKKGRPTLRFMVCHFVTHNNLQTRSLIHAGCPAQSVCLRVRDPAPLTFNAKRDQSHDKRTFGLFTICTTANQRTLFLIKWSTTWRIKNGSYVQDHRNQCAQNFVTVEAYPRRTIVNSK